ncbi:hypothetical protein ACQPZF_01535 [Actinosynnema sp. CS-041913]|uniref:hypothetical protein n=1 Tax=Actinosynnema sp. CS-041913 TaxID=3239917 RepID=UPI003D90AB87
MPAASPEELPVLFAKLFNEGDPAALYEPGAQPPALAGHLALNATMRVTPRKILTNGDLALLIVDWQLGDERGTAVDVARKGPAGWRYVIDNPSGIS